MRLSELIKEYKEENENSHSLICKLIYTLRNFYEDYNHLMDMDVPEYMDDVRLRPLISNLLNLMKILEEIDATKLVEPKCISGTHESVSDTDPYTADALKYFGTNAYKIESHLGNIGEMLSYHIIKRMLFTIDIFKEIYNKSIELGIWETQSNDSTKEGNTRVIQDLIRN